MLRPKVYIAKKISKEVEDYIGEFCDYEMWRSDEKITREELIKNIADKDGLMLTRIKVDKELVDNANKLKVISNISVGYNNFDLEEMKRH